MPRKRLPADDPREWLNRARNNLARAQNPVSNDYLEDYCFDAQQAAEKAIKAVFVLRRESFPYTHNLAKLLRLLEEGGVRIPKYVARADELTPFAAEPRYPGHGGPVSKRLYRRLVRIAGTTVLWATRLISKNLP
jgi:HEPN domain-containing protein